MGFSLDLRVPLVATRRGQHKITFKTARAREKQRDELNYGEIAARTEGFRTVTFAPRCARVQNMENTELFIVRPLGARAFLKGSLSFAT